MIDADRRLDARAPTGERAAIHVDLDGATDIYRGHGWPYRYSDDPLFESGLNNLLDLFDRNGLRATLFVIANSLEDPRKRIGIEEAVRRGHEIASHTLTHQYLPQIDDASKRREIAGSRSLLERELGVVVRGFRAPGYQIDRASIELVAEGGYEYDASVFPTQLFARRLETPVSTLHRLHHPVPRSALLEWPMPEYAPLPFPFNPSYSLLLGTWYFRWGLERFRRACRPLVMLFHLTDASDPLPRARLHNLQQRLFTLSTISAAEKIRRCQEMIDAMRRSYDVTTTLAVLEEWRKAAAPERRAAMSRT